MIILALLIILVHHFVTVWFILFCCTYIAPRESIECKQELQVLHKVHEQIHTITSRQLFPPPHLFSPFIATLLTFPYPLLQRPPSLIFLFFNGEDLKPNFALSLCPVMERSPSSPTRLWVCSTSQEVNENSLWSLPLASTAVQIWEMTTENFTGFSQVQTASKLLSIWSVSLQYEDDNRCLCMSSFNVKMLLCISKHKILCGKETLTQWYGKI